MTRYRAKLQNIMEANQKLENRLLNEKIITEQVSEKDINPKNLKFGDRGPDVATLQQKLMNMGFLKLKSGKPTQYFGNLTNKALARALGKPEPKTVGTEPTGVTTDTNKKTIGCPVIGPQSDIKDLNDIVKYVGSYQLINTKMNTLSKSYTSQGIPQRTACELALIQIRPGYKDKNVFVVDTLNKLIYLYGSNGKFIAKDVIISGKNKQSIDPAVIAKSLLTWNEQAKKLGFEWKGGQGYMDTTGKNRKYDSELIYADTDKSKTRFLPKGIYVTGPSINSNPEYAGKEQNILSLYDGNKSLAQAIHGYYLEQPRTQALEKAKSVLSNPNDPKVGKDFMNLVSKGGVNLSQSYGCINLTKRFLEYIRKYGADSYVFNLGEDKENYLVDNSPNYFDKMINSAGCPSPKSLGAVPTDPVA